MNTPSRIKPEVAWENQTEPTMRARATSRRAKTTRRRAGVTGVLSMMFLILFSSLAVAMAVMSKGNLRSAETHERVSRAQSAVDTGLRVAESRLREAASRLVAARGEIDGAYADQLWRGTYAAAPSVRILPAPDGRAEPNTPAGLADIISMHHGSDAPANPVSAVALGAAPAGWVRAPLLAIERNGQGQAVNAVQLDYGPPDASGRIRVIATGYEWDWLRERWVTRTAERRFQVGKTLRHAIISPSRVMLGRNVSVEGPLGVRYDSNALDTLDGPPLVSRSDFEGLDAGLDAKLQAFYAAVLADDVDGDNRLRINHPIESRSLAALNLIDFSGDSTPDRAFEDYTRDGTISDFDIFLKHFDANGDGRVVLSAALTAGTPAQGLAPEFTLDDALALMIDGGHPDRNRNGRWNGRLTGGAWDFSTFPDNNRDGLLDAKDIDWDDVALGYRDGVLDYRDRYSKIGGSVYFRARRSDWESSRDGFGVAIGDYQKLVQGPIRGEEGEAPVIFEASDAEVPEITEESFAEAAEIMGGFSQQAGIVSDDFDTVTAAQRGVEWLIESTPYGSPTPADWYRRPVYRGLTFRNTVIPRGTNALFIDCVFVGVTRIETWTDNTHPSWTYYGEEERDPATEQLRLRYPPPPAESPAALDTGYSTPGAPGYDSLPPPLMVDLNRDGNPGEVCTDTKLVSNNIRFHGCVFIGGLVADKPIVYTHVRNKVQFTGATKFLREHPTEPNNPAYKLTEAEASITRRSSMMLPHYSVDLGTNNSPPEQDIRLKGAIIAGVLDVRGNAEIEGILLTTFRPVHGQAPLSVYGTPAGNPANFNVTLGYFGPDDGDEEGIDLLGMRDLDGDGVLDVGWDSARDASGALVPVGTTPVEEWWFDGVPDDHAMPGVHIRRAIPFNGFGRITLRLDPTLVLPDGLEAPISIAPVPSSYIEGRTTYAGGG